MLAELSYRIHHTRKQSQVETTEDYDMCEKSVICVFFSLRGFLAVLLLGNGESFNSDFMTNVVFREIVTKITEERLQKCLKSLILHMDNAPCHNSRQMMIDIRKFGLARFLHRPYSPDFANRLLALRFREREIET
jgi:mRNA deadenylase 3'-5' endonuclease subunit Ccr4